MANAERIPEIDGAFEVFKDPETGETFFDQLVIVGRDRLLRKGEVLPKITGSILDSSGDVVPFDLDSQPGVLVLGFVNKFTPDSTDCLKQAREMEDLAKSLEGIATVIEFSRQSPAALKQYAAEHGITHQLVSIDLESALSVGAVLKPAKDADGEPLAAVEFWGTDDEALCRMALVVGIPRTIEFIEQLMDQAKLPNAQAAGIVALNISK